MTSAEKQRLWRQANPDKVRAARVRYVARHHDRCLARYRRYRLTHKDKFRGYKKREYAALRDGARRAYGEQCTCCGETEPSFLTVDHIKNDGAAQRKKLGFSSGYRLLQWLKDNGYPPGFQTLCRNCNWAKHALGKCPHQA